MKFRTAITAAAAAAPRMKLPRENTMDFQRKPMERKPPTPAIKALEKKMTEHAKNLEFEEAAAARDELFKLRQKAFGADQHGSI